MRPDRHRALMGDSIATNMFMLGYAFQKGLVPVSSVAINKAIELERCRGENEPGRFPVGTAGRGGPDRSRATWWREAGNGCDHDHSQTLEEMVARRVNSCPVTRTLHMLINTVPWSSA